MSKHQSLEDRMAAAQILITEDPLCPVVVDQMSNSAAMEYGALPERLYVLHKGKVLYVVSPQLNATLPLSAVSTWGVLARQG